MTIRCHRHQCIIYNIFPLYFKKKLHFSLLQNTALLNILEIDLQYSDALFSCWIFFHIFLTHHDLVEILRVLSAPLCTSCFLTHNISRLDLLIRQDGAFSFCGAGGLIFILLQRHIGSIFNVYSFPRSFCACGGDAND